MADTTLDMRDLPPMERYPETHATFDDLDTGESLTVLNDHDPKPLFYEMQAEVDAFDADSYTTEQRASDEFTATFPKR